MGGEWDSIWNKATIPTPAQEQYLRKYGVDTKHEEVRVTIDAGNCFEFMYRDGTTVKLDREVYP